MEKGTHYPTPSLENQSTPRSKHLPLNNCRWWVLTAVKEKRRSCQSISSKRNTAIASTSLQTQCHANQRWCLMAVCVLRKCRRRGWWYVLLHLSRNRQQKIAQESGGVKAEQRRSLEAWTMNQQHVLWPHASPESDGNSRKIPEEGAVACLTPPAQPLDTVQ